MLFFFIIDGIISPYKYSEICMLKKVQKKLWSGIQVGERDARAAANDLLHSYFKYLDDVKINPMTKDNCLSDLQSLVQSCRAGSLSTPCPRLLKIIGDTFRGAGDDAYLFFSGVVFYSAILNLRKFEPDFEDILTECSLYLLCQTHELGWNDTLNIYRFPETVNSAFSVSNMFERHFVASNTTPLDYLRQTPDTPFKSELLQHMSEAA